MSYESDIVKKKSVYAGYEAQMVLQQHLCVGLCELGPYFWGRNIKITIREL